jgi:hypothetical protein
MRTSTDLFSCSTTSSSWAFTIATSSPEDLVEGLADDVVEGARLW